MISASSNMPKKIQLSEPPPRIQVDVRSVTLLGDQIFKVCLSALSIPWKPGDCIAVYGSKGSSVSRPYSLSGAVDAPELELWVRKFEQGEISPYLCTRQAGDKIESSRPFGWFRPAEPEQRDKFYFATGTGIAPFLSSIQSGSALPRGVFWGLRKPLNFMPDFPVRIFLSQFTHPEYSTGRLTQALSEVAVHEHTHIYACGLDQMIDEVMVFFKQKGLPESNLHSECFFTA